MADESSALDLLRSGPLLERLAASEHERWSHWQRYVHEQATRLDDGSLLIPAPQVADWERQIATVYADLSNDEQQSDRDQVARYLPIIVDAIRRLAADPS